MVTRLAREKVRLAALKQEVENQHELVTSLEAELGRMEVRDSGAESVPRIEAAAPDLSNSEIVNLFRSLFRGREDVFPRRWENPKSGRSGYAPACENEW
jgi:hypothetical protein